MSTQTTPLGNISTKKSPGRTWKRAMRLERVARLELTGLYTEDEIAISQGVTKQYINMLKRSPDYIAIRMQVATGVIAQADREMYEEIEENHGIIREMLPEALQVVRDTLLDRSQPALRLKAAQDLLDREGTFAKVSKSEIKVKKDYDYSQHSAAEDDLLAALQANTNKHATQTIGVEEFSTSPGDPKETEKLLEESLELIKGVVISQGPKSVQ